MSTGRSPRELTGLSELEFPVELRESLYGEELIQSQTGATRSVRPFSDEMQPARKNVMLVSCVDDTEIRIEGGRKEKFH